MRPAILRDGWQRLLQLAERQLPALTRYRRPEALPIALHSRRVYVLPTAFGLLFGAMLLIMLLGALNFNNNAALILTFTMAGAAMVSLQRTVSHLTRLRLLAVRAEPVHAGDDLLAAFHFAADDARERLRLTLTGDSAQTRFDLTPNSGIARIALPTSRRGWHRVGRFTLSTMWPFGLFRAWSVLHPEQQLLVYPRAERAAPPLPREGTDDAGSAISARGEDWHGLRDYRVGDPLRVMAWKPSARHDRLLIKEFAEPLGDQIVLDYTRTGLMDPEPRISRLTRWVLDSCALNLSYQLKLPSVALGPGRGQDHLATCLRELALLP